jgi:hypothetical protein
MNNITYNLGGVELINYYDNNSNRFIKLLNNSGVKKSVKILYYYPSVSFPYYSFEKILNINEWIIPEYKQLNSCGYIIVYINEKIVGKITLLSESNLKPLREKIICVGLNKTGTSSLARDLKLLGYTTWADGETKHQLSFSYQNFSNKAIGSTIDLIEKTEVDFFQDIPFSCPKISEKIINIFPQIRYVLTVRDGVDEWVKSVKNFWRPFFHKDIFNPNAIFSEVERFDMGYVPDLSYLLNMFETWELDKYEGSIDEKLAQVYINHNNSVINTLENNGCDWIKINVSKKGELKRLTDWLKIENDKQDFVWINKTN